jgi:hypothetical protein
LTETKRHDKPISTILLGWPVGIAFGSQLFDDPGIASL